MQLVVGEQVAFDPLGEPEPVKHRPEGGPVVHRGDLKVGLLGWWSWSISPDGVSWLCSNCVTIFTRTTWGDDG